jgi:hypothetical protein
MKKYVVCRGQPGWSASVDTIRMKFEYQEMPVNVRRIFRTITRIEIRLLCVVMPPQLTEYSAFEGTLKAIRYPKAKKLSNMFLPSGSH